MSDKCEHRLDYEAEMDYWPKDEPCWRCWAEVARPVYDAAMALFEDGDGMIVNDSPDDPESSGAIYSSAKKIETLWNACRRAKEGR